jgi:hypothetical protein
MTGWLPAVLALTAGSLGGVLNAITTDNGFIVPQFAKMDGTGASIWRPGVIGNVVVGAIAALVSWALYGPAAGLPLGDFKADLTWAGFASGVLVGMGGARWLSSEVDKSLLKGAAAAVAGKQSNPQLAGQMAALTPAQSLAAAVNAPH